MEINDTTIPLIWFYQLYGFAPYKIVRNKVNQIIDFKRNRILCIYGVTIIITFTLASNYALLYDFYSGHALRYLFCTNHFQHNDGKSDTENSLRLIMIFLHMKTLCYCHWISNFQNDNTNISHCILFGCEYRKHIIFNNYDNGDNFIGKYTSCQSTV